MEFSSLSLIFLLIGFFHCSLSQHSDEKPTVRVNRNSVYTGDNVTLTCDLQPATGWREFYWYRDDQSPVSTSTNTYSVQLFTSGVIKFSCSARGENNHYAPRSDAVQVTVIMKPTLRVNQNSVYTGDSVTLTCDLQPATGWKEFFWNRDDESTATTYSNKYKVQLSKSGVMKFRCSALGENNDYTARSDSVQITVGMTPTVRVNQNSVYTGDSVTLTCDLDPATGWREFSWNREYQSPVTTSTNTYSVQPSDIGIIRLSCAARRENNFYAPRSDSVLIIVYRKPKSTVMINPGGNVSRGEPVNLTCTIQGYKASEWQYSWYKDGSDAVISTDQVYTISHVTETHSGKYTCRGRDHQGSSHISDAVTLTVPASGSGPVPQNWGTAVELTLLWLLRFIL